jgi:hypothetical protein
MFARFREVNKQLLRELSEDQVQHHLAHVARAVMQGSAHETVQRQNILNIN